MAGLFDLLGQAVNQRLGVDRNHFIDNELPQIAQGFKDAQSREEIDQQLGTLIKAASRAGYQPEHVQKLSEMLIGPAAERLRRGELDRIRADYGPQTTPITPMVAPEGQGQPLPANTSFTPQTTPGKPLDQEGVFRIAQALNTNAPGFNTLLRTPAQIASRQASEAKTRQELEANQAKEAAYGDLPTTEIPGTGVNVRTAGRLGQLGGFITGTMQQPNREAALDIRRQGLDVQRERLQLLADRVATGSATATERAELARERLNFDKQKFEQQKAGSETVTNAPIKPEEKLLADRAFARTAVDRGIDKMPKGPERDAALQKLADEMDLELTGSPDIKVPDNTRLFGLMDKPKSQQEPVTFSGASLKRKPKTVTKGRPGEQPAPQGGAPAAPKVGTVVRGYRFKGGDPSQQANWEQVQ